MSASKPAIPFTYEDYKSLPESLERYELMDGELYVSPAPTTTHQTIVQNIQFLLVQHTRATRAGRVLHAPVDVVLGEAEHRSVVQPDILFVGRGRESIITEAEVAGAPDLVIEVLSPGSEDRDRGLKKTLYARAGVPEYWIVDPETEHVDVLMLAGEGYRLKARYEHEDEIVSGVIPGLQLPLAQVFRET